MKRAIVGFYKDAEERVRPITKSLAELNRKKILKNPKPFKSVKPSWKRRPIFTLRKGEVEMGIYDKDRGIIGSVPIASYDPHLLNQGYVDETRPPNLPGVKRWSSPDLTPSKLVQRQAVAEKMNGGTVLELYAGKGNLSNEVWASKADKLVLVDKNPSFLKEADRKLKGKVKREIIVADNLKWLRNVMKPEELGRVKAVDFDAFGSPSTGMKTFFDNYPIRNMMFICVTDGSNIFLAFQRKRKSALNFLRKHYGLTFEPTGKREDQIKALDALMQQQGRKHDFSVEPINVAFGKRQSVYAAYKISPK